MSFKKKIEEQAVKEDIESRSLMCQAHGCPSRWSVDMGQRFCSKHAWSDSKDWGSITATAVADKFLKPPVKYFTEADDDAIY